MAIDKDRVIIFDSTLRDAEQAPGASLNIPEKLEIAHQLNKLGVDVIEAGFAVSSPVQYEAVNLIAKEVHGPVIASLARTVQKDIDSAAKALAPAVRKRIHTFTSTSPVQMEYMLKKTPAEVLASAVEAVKYARSVTDDVEFSAQDASRSDQMFLREIVQAVIEAGATTINIPDTVGYATPELMGAMIKDLIENVPGAKNVIFSMHCHNDLGLASANSLAGVVAGARQIECTINGLGERAGNASLEEVVMAMKVRNDYYKLHTGIKTEEIYRTSQMVSRLMGIEVQVNKAIVGANAFAHESGIHVDGILKNRETYEIMTPASVGVSTSRMVLGRHSGKHGFKKRCEELGFDLTEAQINEAFDKFLELADKKKEIYDEDICSILEVGMDTPSNTYKLEYLQVSSGSGTIPSATVKIRRCDEVLQHAAWGDGPVDAAYNAISAATGVDVHLDKYQIRAVTGDSKALGEAVLRITHDGRSFTGHGASTDIVEASAMAYISAINHMIRFNETAKKKQI